MISALDLPALGVAASYLALGVIIAALLKKYDFGDSIVLVALLVLPLLTYGVASGKISEITGPGGVSAKFAQVAAATVKPSPLGDKVDEFSAFVTGAEDMFIFEKGGLSQIQEYLQTLVPGKPIAISLNLGSPGFYVQDAIILYIKTFLTFDPNLTIIFVDDRTGQYNASTNASSVLAALTLQRGDGSYDDSFVRALEAGDLIALQRLVVLTTSSVTAETTNAEALRMMVDDGVDSIIKVDAEGTAVGIVRRDQIISSLMLGLTDG